MKQIRDEIERCVLSAYTDRQEPSYAFVQPRRAEDPYADLRDSLGRLCVLTDDTDLNTDVAECLLAAAHSDSERIFLRLSYVGPFAAVFRLTPDGLALLLDPESTVLTQFEQAALDAVKSAGVAVLGRGELERPIELMLEDSEAGSSPVYQALFSQLADLPWQLDRGGVA